MVITLWIILFINNISVGGGETNKKLKYFYPFSHANLENFQTCKLLGIGL